MRTTIEDRMRSIYEILDKDPDSKIRYELSQRDSPHDNELREFLLKIHQDNRLASLLQEEEMSMQLYDPNPDNETGWYLGWQEHDKEVQFVHQQPIWGVGHGRKRIVFEVVNGRFYANRRELLDCFPRLTSEKLEECIIEAYESTQQWKAEHQRECCT